jgi:formamidopyrimidine-DNA glycosylase
MPEFPDITVYIEALEKRMLGRTLKRVQIGSLFLLRTAVPPVEAVQGHKAVALRRIGKRLAIAFDNDHWLVFHLMIAGRLHWRAKSVKPDGRRVLAAFDFGVERTESTAVPEDAAPGQKARNAAETGTLTLTEAGSRKRASLHVIAGEEALRKLDPGGIDVFAATPEEFAARLTSANHTLKRALTDPRLFSGIGNAYSDEILHHARLSPVALTQRLKADEIRALHESSRCVLALWTETLRKEAAGDFPENVTAFREGMTVHGKYQQPCPVCGAKVQRIRYASNETNYCPRCQTGGKLLADRALSRILRDDWPRSLDEMEER